MKSIVKKILKEEVNNLFLEKIFNLIKKDLNFHPLKGIEINLSSESQNANDLIDRSSGINIQLKNGGFLNKFIVSYGMSHFGLTETESEELWIKIKTYLKKENFVLYYVRVVFEDYIQYEPDPYFYPIYEDEIDDYSVEGGFNLKKLDEFIKFMDYIGYGKNMYDAHSDEKINLLSLLDEEDYKYIQEDMLDRIEDSY